MFSGASHPSKHTLVSYQAHFIGDDINSEHKAHSSFETFASHEDWREDALCIPKCISSMSAVLAPASMVLAPAAMVFEPADKSF